MSIDKYYEQIIHRMVAYDKYIKVNRIFTRSEIEGLMRYLKAIDPSLFHVSSLSYGSSAFGSTVIYPQYSYSQEEYTEIKGKISEWTKPIKQHLRTLDGDLKKEKCVHDYICTNVKYVDNGQVSHTLVGPILHGEGVCDGISQATQFLLKTCGVKSYLAIGEGKNTVTNASEGHGWNVVCIDGKWYHLDVTFDLGISKDIIRYDYFNLDHKRICKDHKLDYAPLDCKKECIHTDDYYNTRKISFSDMEIVKKYFIHVISKRRDTVQIRLEGEHSQELVNKTYDAIAAAVVGHSVAVQCTGINPVQNVMSFKLQYT